MSGFLEEEGEWDRSNIFKSIVFKNIVYKINKIYEIIDLRILENVSR